MKLQNPGDCFKELWQSATLTLRALNRNVWALSAFSISYECVPTHFMRGSLPYSGKLTLYPYCRIVIEVPHAPPYLASPDLHTQPEMDAIVLAHEYGHLLTYKNLDKGGRKAHLDVLFRYNTARMNYFGRPAEEDGEAIWQDEIKAWRNAKKFLKTLGCRDWRMFRSMQKQCLASYRKTFEVDYGFGFIGKAKKAA